jgi:hypothetical protein
MTVKHTPRLSGIILPAEPNPIPQLFDLLPAFPLPVFAVARRGGVVGGLLRDELCPSG